MSFPTPTTALPKGTLSALLAVERSQIGYNGGGTEDNPSTKYGAWNGYDGSLGSVSAQWCLMFQNWCFSWAGIPILPQPGWQNLGRGALAVADAYAAYRSAGQFNGANSSPAPGDLVFFQYPGYGAPDHVGLVESYDPNVRLITSIQGNTTDAGIGRTGNCCRRKVHGFAYVVGFGRPAYSTATPTPAPTTGVGQEGDSGMINVILSKGTGDRGRGAAFLLPNGSRTPVMASKKWTAINHAAKAGAAVHFADLDPEDYDAFGVDLSAQRISAIEDNILGLEQAIQALQASVEKNTSPPLAP